MDKTQSTINFYNVLKTHNILIYGAGFTPSQFSYDLGAIWVKNECLGFFIHEGFTKDKNAFNKHIKKMLKQGLSINIICRGCGND